MQLRVSTLEAERALLDLWCLSHRAKDRNLFLRERLGEGD